MRFIKEKHPVDKYYGWKFGHILLGDQFHHILQNLVHSTLRAVPRRQNLTVHFQAIDTQKHSYNAVHTQNSGNLVYPKFYCNSITDLKRTTSLETLHLDELHMSDHIESRSQIRLTRCKCRVHTQRSLGQD